MRQRTSNGSLAAIPCVVLLLAGPMAFYAATIGGALSALAQTPKQHELVPVKSAETNVGGQAVAEKSIGEKAGEKSTGEKSMTEKSAGERSNGEKTVGEKTTGEKSTEENVTGKKGAGEKGTGGKGTGGKGTGEKGAGEKGTGEKSIVEKINGKNTVGRKGAGEKVASERGADEKHAGDRNVNKNLGEKIGAGEGAAKESFLTWLYRSLGLRYVIIFLIITFNAVALIVMIVLGLRRNAICPGELAAAFEAKLNDRQYQEAYELAKKNRSFLGKVLAAGMSRLSDGYDASLEAMQEVGEEQNMRFEQRNGYIALIAQIGPMFGLLGTVDGMVMAFDVIAHSNVTPKPSELAQGIGTALVTTVVGLWIAIPMIAFYHIIRNRLTRLILEAGVVSGDLMKRFAAVQASTKKN